MQVHDVQPGNGSLIILRSPRGEQLPLQAGEPFLAEVLEQDGARVLLAVAGRLLRCETSLPLKPGTAVWLSVKEATAQRLVLALAGQGAAPAPSAPPRSAPLAPSPLAQAVTFLLANGHPAAPDAVESVAAFLSGRADLAAALSDLSRDLSSALASGALPADALPPGLVENLEKTLAAVHYTPTAPPDAAALARQAETLKQAIESLGLDYEPRLAAFLENLPEVPAPASAASPPAPQTPQPLAPEMAQAPPLPEAASSTPAAAPPLAETPPAQTAPASGQTQSAPASVPPAPGTAASSPALAQSPAPEAPPAWHLPPPLAESDLKGLLLLLRQVLADLPGRRGENAELPRPGAGSVEPGATPPPSPVAPPAPPPEIASGTSSPDRPAPAPTLPPARTPESSQSASPPPPENAPPAQAEAAATERLAKAVDGALHNLNGQRLLSAGRGGEGQERLEFCFQLPVAVGDQRHTAELRLYREAGSRSRGRGERPAALRVSCRLSTTHLGPVRIDLAVRPKGTTEARLYLGAEPVAELFRTHEPELRDALAAAGLRLGRVSYSLLSPARKPGKPASSAGNADGRPGAIDLWV